MDTFREAYQRLNPAQREAVDYIDGPLFVLAGPGTGKTQLLSARVANILVKTDTPARNILCLTFTESGAENMRERLGQIAGRAAFDVQIYTYHAFGSELIRRFAEHFPDMQQRNPVDELGRRQIIEQIVDSLSYDNPIRQTRYHLDDLISTISDIKRASLSPDDLRNIADNNLRFIRAVNHELTELMAHFVRMPKLSEALKLFGDVRTILIKHGEPITPVGTMPSTSSLAVNKLSDALLGAEEAGKTTPLTVWKNDWLVKDHENRYVFDGTLQNRRVLALADVLDRYEASLALRELFDFDDMINSAAKLLEKNDELRYTLQERYLYILLDEYQDTSASQARLVQLLTDNPVNEGRPNIMAVGDDDQAIYAFQGALYSNMRDFQQAYRGVKQISLTENYRSHPEVLYVAKNISAQIQDRAADSLGSSSKMLDAANTSRFKSHAKITRREFLSDIAQNDRIARDIRSLIDRGTHPRDIAVLSPRHRQLEQLVPFLREYAVPLHYEKSENILETPAIQQLITMSRLTLAISDGDEGLADHYWPEVLSYDFWHLPVSRIWEVSWQVADAKSRGQPTSWTRVLQADGESLRVPALLFLTLATKAGQETCETMLDYLAGTISVDTREADLPKVYSPYREFYTSKIAQEDDPELFYQIISHLTVLRKRFREHQAAENKTCMLSDLIEFVRMYEAAGERMLNTSPYAHDENAVQLMTVYKAKGLEFEHVFLPNCQDEIWGSAAAQQANRLTLPPNLTPIRHVGATEDERLRLLYVAVTRAKSGLHLASSSRSFTGKPSKHLKYFDEREDEQGTMRDYILPPASQTVQSDDTLPPPLRAFELDWRQKHDAAASKVSLRSLLQKRIGTYRATPTHLGTFLDLEYGGPERFYFNSILRFPEAPRPDSEFGNAIHETLEWYQREITQKPSPPDTVIALDYFTQRMQRKKLTSLQIEFETERGRAALAAYLSARGSNFKSGSVAEMNFAFDNIRIHDVPLTGKIDRLDIDHGRKSIIVVDYKTGKSYSRWINSPKLYKYRRQLSCYKLLVEHSDRYPGYTVAGGRLEFVEPNDQGHVSTLECTFTDDELRRTRQLLMAFWQHVRELSFPGVDSYAGNLQGIKQFENDLINHNI